LRIPKKSVRLIQRFIRSGPDFSGGFEKTAWNKR
jgi:hypothetical protein